MEHLINYNDKKFRPIDNTENGVVSKDVLFVYRQKNNVVSCEYEGGKIVKGHLIGLVDKNGVIDMHYHQVHADGTLMTGICTSKPEILKNGKIRLHETWQWTSGDQSKGQSTIEEI